MDEQSLTGLLREGLGDDPKRTDACPDENVLAEYVEGVLPGTEREPLEHHLADCARCLALVGLLVRSAEPGEPRTAPERAAGRTLTTNALPTAGPHRSWWRSGRGLAAAASVLIAVAAVVRLAGPFDRPDATATQARITRGEAAAHPALQVLDPAPGAVLDVAQFSVRWTPVPDGREYDVRIVSDSGDVVGTAHVETTEWRPGETTALEPGRDYYVVVVARLPDGRTLSSEHVPFRVSD
jgi:anti-sigma factor RsiW